MVSWRRATHERSCVPPAREGAERSRTHVPTAGAHLDALHEGETSDPRGDRQLRDERVLAVVIAIIISIVVVLRLCLCVPVGTTPPSSHPSVLPLRSLVRYLSRLGSRSDRKRRCCGVCILVSRASCRLPTRSAAMSSAVRFSITPKQHHNYITTTSQLHQPSHRRLTQNYISHLHQGTTPL